ncbi:MAG TPA: prepilin-type N-terminal cleavage/methylation domain-containing protein [Candidatus Methylomirabilis sp.]
MNPPLRSRRGGGFTLIELMIVITIIGILATISQPMFRNAMLQAREAALRENLYVLRDAIDKFYADNDKYPEGLTDLAEKRYVRKVPKDPITGSAETWQAVHFTDEKGQQAGIMDVKSGSDATGSDGQKYSEW